MSARSAIEDTHLSARREPAPAKSESMICLPHKFLWLVSEAIKPRSDSSCQHLPIWPDAFCHHIITEVCLCQHKFIVEWFPRGNDEVSVPLLHIHLGQLAHARARVRLTALWSVLYTHFAVAF